MPAAPRSRRCGAWTRQANQSISKPSPAKPECHDPGSTPNQTYAPTFSAYAKPTGQKPVLFRRGNAAATTLCNSGYRSPPTASDSSKPTTRFFTKRSQTHSASNEPRPAATPVSYTHLTLPTILRV